MDPRDRVLLASASAKRAQPETMTAAERDVFLTYGTQHDARLLEKAAAPPPAPVRAETIDHGSAAAVVPRAIGEGLVDALDTYTHAPELLTDAQITLLTKADPALGRRARTTRGAVRRADAIIALVTKALHQPTQRLAALEARVLELEARAATAVEAVPDA